jgi:hypothetical protein
MSIKDNDHANKAFPLSALEPQARLTIRLKPVGERCPALGHKDGGQRNS